MTDHDKALAEALKANEALGAEVATSTPDLQDQFPQLYQHFPHVVLVAQSEIDRYWECDHVGDCEECKLESVREYRAQVLVLAQLAHNLHLDQQKPS